MWEVHALFIGDTYTVQAVLLSAHPPLAVESEYYSAFRLPPQKKKLTWCEETNAAHAQRVTVTALPDTHCNKLSLH